MDLLYFNESKEGLLMTQEILPLNCEKCRLRTEHARIRTPDGTFSYRCLKCGNMRSSANESEEKNYPKDDTMPSGVG